MKAKRFLALVCGCIAMSSPAAYACDLQLTTKQTDAARYIESVQTCLEALPVGFEFDRQIEQDNIKSVNTARLRRGLQPLKIRTDLIAAARWHSLDMAANGYFQHRGADNRSHDQRISLLDRTLLYNAARENIAMMQGGFERGTENKTLHDLLMESEGHYKNIMAENITHIAVGVVRWKDGVWLTQLFVSEAGELSAPAPVRLSPGQIISLSAELTEWTFAGFQAEQGANVERFGIFKPDGRAIVPPKVAGDIRLGVRGERAPTSERERGYFINLSGPSVTITAPITKVLPAK